MICWCCVGDRAGEIAKNRKGPSCGRCFFARKYEEVTEADCIRILIRQDQLDRKLTTVYLMYFK